MDRINRIFQDLQDFFIKLFQQITEKRIITPAKTGSKKLITIKSLISWIPAFAGMTDQDVSGLFQKFFNPVNPEKSCESCEIFI